MHLDAPRLKALWPWLKEARYLGLSVVVIGIALTISLRPQTTEPTIRLTGLALQLLGIATVIWGISDTRALFGHQSLASKVNAYFRRFPLIPRRIILASAGGALLSNSTAKARAYGTHRPGENPTIDTRLEALEKNVDSLHKRISETQHEIDAAAQKAAEALVREVQTRQEEHQAIRDKLNAAATGGVHISAIGASWLFVGVILSTAAIEIAEFVK